MLTLLDTLKSDQRKARYRCECGKVVVLWRSNVYTGHTQSCGCLRRQVNSARSTTHGHKTGGKRTRAYVAWVNMKARCSNENRSDYVNYGGRGIGYISEWERFEAFLADMGEPAKGMTLDRIDNGAGYSKSNCQWVSRSVQAVNKRNVRLYTYAGRTNTIAGWAREVGLERLTLRYRLNKGWPIERALKEKVQ
jgi:hypothetical protein